MYRGHINSFDDERQLESQELAKKEETESKDEQDRKVREVSGSVGYSR